MIIIIKTSLVDNLKIFVIYRVIKYNYNYNYEICLDNSKFFIIYKFIKYNHDHDYKICLVDKLHVKL